MGTAPSLKTFSRSMQYAGFSNPPAQHDRLGPPSRPAHWGLPARSARLALPRGFSPQPPNVTRGPSFSHPRP
eukprot:1173942-Pyramimonas_sp.AAC.1